MKGLKSLLSAQPFGPIALVGLTLALGFLLGVPQLTHSQVPSFAGPFNVDTGAIITNVTAPAGIVNSANQNNVDQQGAVCTYNATAQTGQPSVNFAIQGFDAGTASWFNYVVSNAITQANVPTPILAYPLGAGVVNAIGSQLTLPAGMQVVSLPLPRIWRVSEIISGSGSPTVTAKIGCVVLR